MRGRRVPVPRGEVRPTSERARQAYFNIVADRVSGARFLDLFAGSGIFSFEALSRGAASAVAVDVSAKNIATIEKTAELFGVKLETIVADIAHTEVIATGARDLARRGRPQRTARSPRSLATLGMTFDLVYADPPYDFGRYDELLETIDALPLAPGAVVSLEHRRLTTPFTVQPRRLSLWRRAEYGEVWITMFTAPGLQSHEEQMSSEN